MLFGKDILINDKSSQNQRAGAMCSAFNGWLYAIYSHNAGDSCNWTIMRSMDNGITWNTFVDVSEIVNDYFPNSFNIVACGNNLSDLKVFISGIYYFTYSDETQLGVEGFDGQTGNWEGQWLLSLGQFSTQYSNCAIASDYQHPSTNSSPYSLGILYTKSSLINNYYKDSLIFESSSDGGVSIDNRKAVASAKDFTHKFGKVSLSYGYSPSWSSGRYFATWEEKDLTNATRGHIFTSHTITDINSQFSEPICLDSLDASTINLCRNPKVSCQVNSVDNDSSNLTQVVLFEKFIPNASNYNLSGCYNLQATSSNHFTKFNAVINNDNDIQPDITFNPFDNDFYVTYFDSTIRQLPLLSNNFNMTTPNSWYVISSGYNDSTNLIAPYPKVAINPVEQESANFWIAERNNGNGVAMFDAQYSTYTGFPINTLNDIADFLEASPNPCKTYTSIVFELKQKENVSIELYSLEGQHLTSFTYEPIETGKHKVNIDVSDISSGCYIFSFTAGGFTKIGKIIVIK